ncbi:galactokinase [soil metagenome]
MSAARVRAFAPGRVNLIGEHTDYNDGLSLPFAIVEGVTVDAMLRPGREVVGGGPSPLVSAVVEELRAAGQEVPGAEIGISSNLAEGEGLASSAALAVATALALLGLAGERAERVERVELVRLCQRAEHRALGTRSGLLDQLASLCGSEGHAARIDFRSLEVDPVPLGLLGWRLGVASSGERRELAASGYNERRAECERAAEMLGVGSLRLADGSDIDRLPDPLNRRLAHVLSENDRVEKAVTALREEDLAGLGRLLDASHASLRDLYDASTAAVERTVDRLHEAGAAGARMMGGGFGGSVLALFGPDVDLPRSVRAVAPAAGAHVLGR